MLPVILANLNYTYMSHQYQNLFHTYMLCWDFLVALFQRRKLLANQPFGVGILIVELQSKNRIVSAHRTEKIARLFYIQSFCIAAELRQCLVYTVLAVVP